MFEADPDVPRVDVLAWLDFIEQAFPDDDSIVPMQKKSLIAILNQVSLGQDYEWKYKNASK